jgi:hypothetical protein
MKVRLGDEFTARFVAYLHELKEEIRSLLAELSPRSHLHLGIKECHWKLGTVVEVKLTGRYCTVSPSEVAFVWEGGRNLAEFDVTIAPDAPEAVTVLKIDLFIDEFLMPGPRLNLGITKQATSGKQHTVATEAAKIAFAS